MQQVYMNARCREILQMLLESDTYLTQQQIADYLGTRQEYYSKYELGKRQLPLHHLKALCEFYNVSADYILGLPKNLYWPR